MPSTTTAVINQKVQIAKQTTFGTAATTGFYELNASSLDLQREAGFDSHKPAGNRHITVSNLVTEQAKIALTGKADYNDLYFWLAGALVVPVTTRLIPSTGLAYEHVFAPDHDGPNARLMYTVNQGDSTYCEQAMNFIMAAIGLKLQRTGGQDITGSGFADAVKDSINDAITMNGSPTELAEAPIPATHFAAYVADTQGGLDGATMLDDPFLMEWMLDAIAGAIFGYNRSASFSKHTETDPKGTEKLKLPINAVSLALRATMRAGATKWIRLQAIGPVIEGATTYTLEIDTKVKVSAAPSKGPEQGALSLEWSFVWSGEGTTVTLINTFAGL